MLSIFDSQKQRLERLAASIVAADDRTLATVLGRAAAAEVAVALRVLPLARANALLGKVPKDVLEQALALTESGGGPDMHAAGRLASELMQELPGAPEVDPHAADATPGGLEIYEVPLPAAAGVAPGPVFDDAPFSVRALDFAGRVLGTFSIEGKS